MLRNSHLIIVLSLCIPIVCSAQIGFGLIRVSCDGDNSRAEIFLNGISKGDCPVDIQAPEGVQLLRAVKPVDQTREKVFEETFRLAAGTAKRIDVQLSQPRLNAIGLAEEEKKKEQEAKLAAARQLEQKAAQQREYEALLAQSTAEDMHAAYQLGLLYQHGNLFINPSIDDARGWLQKASDSGHLIAKRLAPTLGQGTNPAELELLKKIGDAYKRNHVVETVLTDESGDLLENNKIVVTKFQRKTSVETGLVQRFARVSYANQTIPIYYEEWLGLLFSHKTTELNASRIVLYQFGEGAAPYLIEIMFSVKVQAYRDTDATRQEFRASYICEKTDACVTIIGNKKTFHASFKAPVGAYPVR